MSYTEPEKLGSIANGDEIPESEEEITQDPVSFSPYEEIAADYEGDDV
jgi:hypothetical protein